MAEEHIIRLAEACTACKKPANYRCDKCKRVFCSHGSCLFETGDWLTFPSDPRNEDYDENPTWDREEELCMSCYIEKKGHPPLALWAGGSAQTELVMPGILKGVSTPAGDAHSWYAPPQAGNMLKLRWGDQHIELDPFRTLQLLNWLKANETAIQEQAQQASDILVPIERRDTERAIRADLGHYDITHFEE